MKIETSTVTKLTITKVDKLDPVAVYLEDPKPQHGKITITCFGDSWTGYWPAMGDQNIMEFVVSAENEYLISKISSVKRMVTDWDVVAKRTGCEIECDVSAVMYEKDMIAAYGPEWWEELPKKESSDYRYLCRILGAVKGAISNLLKNCPEYQS